MQRLSIQGHSPSCVARLSGFSFSLCLAVSLSRSLSFVGCLAPGRHRATQPEAPDFGSSQSRPAPTPAVRVLRFTFRVSGFEIRVSDFGFRSWGFGFRVSGFGLQVSGQGFRVLVFGSRVPCFVCRTSGFHRSVQSNGCGGLRNEG